MLPPMYLENALIYDFYSDFKSSCSLFHSGTCHLECSESVILGHAHIWFRINHLLLPLEQELCLSPTEERNVVVLRTYYQEQGGRTLIWTETKHLILGSSDSRHLLLQS
jgi:hypothetical protein